MARRRRPAGPVRSVLKAITIDQQKPLTRAVCKDCVIYPFVTRERARQHADNMRHTVDFVTEQHTVYAPTGDTE